MTVISFIVSRHCGPQFASSSYLLNAHYRPGTILNTLVKLAYPHSKPWQIPCPFTIFQVSKGRYKGAHVRSCCLSVEPKLICERSLRSSLCRLPGLWDWFVLVSAPSTEYTELFHLQVTETQAKGEKEYFSFTSLKILGTRTETARSVGSTRQGNLPAHSSSPSFVS